MKELQILLADFNLLNTKINKFHWYLKSNNFLELHNFLGNLSGDMYHFIDRIAEFIRGRNEYPIASLTDYLRLSQLNENTPNNVNSNVVVSFLLNDYRLIKKLINNIINIYKEDLTIQDISIEMLRHIEKTIWFLESIGE